ncbi:MULTISPECIES: hypothetical protein [Alteromonas]|jgi:hypothetical protein|uniref:Uncharacterized protein n=1 Tax=Alteromonas mediterranea TaxID=314275 RepID=A0AAC9F7T7_9ALTE|nr:hypothetical protein [Alteromonas mediterranea]AFV87721.1 hypothetical protein amad1_21438 [Alteromonas mediterranea DE1]AGP87760.1 hypothetical protein I607_20147 [Alteromonas mediterranea U4]AGP99742.1 hypothetical protein I635_21439 [Alteromonas mediterranea UM7]AMJ80841.1 hypothetical protein AV942_20910 [Alteromonas mediterranea]AMJ85005.1 hypothetical protein AV941_21030 [Alteromonas mediterranea]|tara:strand:- start:5886 stop:6698 length:813 start_codon:yes stop_codon:yes gene_type:complete
MTLPNDNPTLFCKAFIQRELDSYKSDSPIWITYWPVMERMIARADELKLPFKELVDAFGYSDKFEGYPPNNSFIWLTLKHIWCSFDYRKEDVVNARDDLKELRALKEDIVELASKLSAKLQRQSELYEISGFSKPDYQFIDDLIEQASAGNYLYKWHVSEKLKSLTSQYDLKYWPSIANLVSAIADFEDAQPNPTHIQYPEYVINDRESDIKDFVLSFDGHFDEQNDLKTGFRFSNNAVADIINVVLDLPVDKLATGDAVRTVRKRFKQS